MEDRNSTKIIIKNLSVPAQAGTDAVFEAAKKKLRAAGIVYKKDALSLYRRSVDARKKNDIRFVCSVEAEIDGKVDESALAKVGAEVLREEKITVAPGSEKMSASPVVVGSGPCGLFCALLLAQNGYSPILLERGADVEARERQIQKFHSTRVLDPDTNVQFGAGGAGTFSDGKLITRINDPLCAYVLSTFREFGAPESIMTLAKPHVGTDNLKKVVSSIIDKIVSLGGKVYFNTKFEGARYENGKVVSVIANGSEIKCGALVLAIGHSARDTYANLGSNGFVMNPKDFSCGVRIEHLTQDIDRAMYGDGADIDLLGHAEYTLSHRIGERGVYSFCMCPGGSVIAAASEEGGVVTNGMSEYARDGRNSNAAIAVSVLKSDYGNTVEGAVAFQRRLERAAFEAGGRDYSAPVQKVGDFMQGKVSSSFGRITPTYADSCSVAFADLSRLMPGFMSEMLKIGITAFDSRISGFAVGDAVLTGFETRTSAPLRIERSEARTAIGYDNVYPAGEGAGYAGGITSAAVDGLRTALAICSRYAPII